MIEPDAALQLEKLRLEMDKLRAEARLLKRWWFLQPAYIAAILPIFALSASAWITYTNSDFKREAEIAKSEVAKLRPEAASLIKQIGELKAEHLRLTADMNVLRPQAAKLQKQVVAFNHNISTWRVELTDISKRLEGLTPHVVSGPVFPPPTAEPERKRIQEIIDSMLSTLQSK